jgi:hypothetical protein
MNLIIFIVVIFASKTLVRHFTYAQQSPNQCNLPNECQLIKPFEIHDRYPYIIKCTLPETTFDIGSNFNENTTKCDELKSNKDFVITFYPSRPLSTHILDLTHNFNFENLKKYIQIFDAKRSYRIKFNYLQGFDMKILNTNLFRLKKGIWIEMFKSKFEFSIDSTPINSCSDLINTNQNWKLQFSGTYGVVIRLNRCEFKTLCPLIFNNSELVTLGVDYMIKSFIKTNYLRFEKLVVDKNRTHIRIQLMRLRITNMENIELTREIYRFPVNTTVESLLNVILINWPMTKGQRGL